MRVFLHTNVPLTNEINFRSSNLNDYDKLWSFLRSIPTLKGKVFPERSDKDAWTCAITSPDRGSEGIVLSGSLIFNDKQAGDCGPLFILRLLPIRLDLSHRLGRRLGSDRFLEINIPNWTVRPLPKILTKLSDRGQELIIEWLIDSTHLLFGRSWKPFYTRPKEKKDVRKEGSQMSEGHDTANRLYFFAVDGVGFRTIPNSIPLPQPQPRPLIHVAISIDDLLNLIRPTKENEDQSFLKLFSRTSLGM